MGQPSHTLQVLNPATLEQVGEVANTSPADVDAAVERARLAAPRWAANPNRGEALQTAAKQLKANVMRLARLLTQEQGKPLREAMEELMGAAHWLRTTAEMELPAPQTISTPHGPARIDRRPAGTVAAITPWNYPVVLAMWKIAPALLTGNCVLLKPSPFTPLTTLELANAVFENLPPGVLQVLPGDDEAGRHLVAHPGVNHISLTGSTAAGRSVGSQAGHDLKSVTLELGGNDPAVILDDADPSAVAEAIFKNAFKNCGQTCTAIKRVYVHRSLFDDLFAACSAFAADLTVGDGLDKATSLGPLNNEPQLKRVQSLVSDAVDRGGSVFSGAAPPDLPGYFHPPTIVAGLPDDAPLVAEEQFGPVLPLLPFDDLDDIVQRINRSQFGLGGSVWATDLERAAEVADRLECATSWINQHGSTDPAVPFGGTKASGLGYANGSQGLEEFARLRVSYGA